MRSTAARSPSIIESCCLRRRTSMPVCFAPSTPRSSLHCKEHARASARHPPERPRHAPWPEPLVGLLLCHVCSIPQLIDARLGQAVVEGVGGSVLALGGYGAGMRARRGAVMARIAYRPPPRHRVIRRLPRQSSGYGSWRVPSDKARRRWNV